MNSLVKDILGKEMVDIISTKDILIESVSIPDMIIFKEKEKKISMKIGRFLRNKIGITDLVYLEKLVNIFKNNIEIFLNKVEIKEYRGIDILKGYDRNFLDLKPGTSLSGSCMLDKFDYLNIYTNNPDVVSLWVVEENNKIISRSLLWNTDKGKFLDKTYTIKQNHYDLFLIKAKNEGIKTYDDKEIDLKVEIKNMDYKNYPYIDNMYCLIEENDKLFLTNKLDKSIPTKILRNTDGTFISSHKIYYKTGELLPDLLEVYIDEAETKTGFAKIDDVYETYSSNYSFTLKEYCYELEINTYSRTIKRYFPKNILIFLNIIIVIFLITVIKFMITIIM